MVFIFNYSKMVSCSGSLLCLPVTRDLIKEPKIMNCGMVSSLDSVHVLRASSSQLHVCIYHFKVCFVVSSGYGDGGVDY